MCLNEIYIYSRVQAGEHLSDPFTIKNGLKQDALSPVLSKCFKRSHQYSSGKPVGLKLNGTYTPLVYTDDVNM
jgi:hypothetical protein